MKTKFRIIIVIILLLASFIVGLFIYETYFKVKHIQTAVVQPSEQTFQMIIPAFANGAMIPNKYTCDGENVAPDIHIFNVPDLTKSLVLIVDDIDAPNGTWIHWMMWNIPPDIKSITKNSISSDIMIGKNGFGKYSYGGPCPMSGRHRYQFSLYAIDSYINIPKESTKDDVIRAMNTHGISLTQYTGVYSR